MKSYRHEIIVKVRFDKPTTQGQATAAFRDCVHGTFFPSAFHLGDLEIMTITSVRNNPRRKDHERR